jgi:hypothetical protein
LKEQIDIRASDKEKTAILVVQNMLNQEREVTAKLQKDLAAVS